MIDLHTHILPGMDDGAKTIEQAMELIRLEIADGVDFIALTPHFNVDISSSELFLNKRGELTHKLQQTISDCGLTIRLFQGAEVRLTPSLPALSDIKGFCYQETDFMLVELPFEYFYNWIPNALFELRILGITPILAHIERYQYFHERPQILERLVNAGAVAQSDAESLLSGSRFLQRYVLEMIRKGLVTLIATDTHSVESRPPRLKAALDLLSGKLGPDYRDRICENAECAAGNKQIPYFSPAGFAK